MGTRAFVPTRKPTPIVGTRPLGIEADSNLELVASLNAGLETESVERLGAYLDVSLGEVLDMTGIKSSTFQKRKKEKKPLTPEESSRLYRAAKVTEAAEAFFENRERAHRWLSQPKVALGGETPFAFAYTAEGADYVISLLGRMEHGVIS